MLVLILRLMLVLILRLMLVLILRLMLRGMLSLNRQIGVFPELILLVDFGGIEIHQFRRDRHGDRLGCRFPGEATQMGEGVPGRLAWFA